MGRGENMTQDIIKRECIWLTKEVCHIKEDEPCPEDCDLKTLNFDKDKIIQRMKEEEAKVKELKKQGMFRNREKIKDKIMGCYSLQKVLKNHFDYIQPKVVDEDFEKSMNFPSGGGWRQKPKR